MEEPAVDAETVRHVTELAYVDVADDALDGHAAQLAEILAWFDALADVPAVEPPDDAANVLRADEVREGLSQAEALANAGEVEDGYFRGPPVG